MKKVILMTFIQNIKAQKNRAMYPIFSMLL